jgi:aquaporin Z
MMDKLIAEMIGTFIFLSVILIAVNGDKSQVSQAWLQIGTALSVCIILIGNVSGAHMNPAVSFMLFKNGDICFSTFLSYTLSQLAGGYLAYLYYNTKIKKA